MDQHPRNPRANQLDPGISDNDLLRAIQASGYSLQSVAVDAILEALTELKKSSGLEEHLNKFDLQVQEEWSYVDADAEQVRHLDALVTAEITPQAVRSNEPLSTQPQGFLRYHLDLLIECKQSELPYVFFLRRTPAGNVPNLLGLPHDHLSIRFDPHAEQSYGMSLFDILRLSDTPFAKEPVTAISMSRAHRKGKELELSGDESYRAITLPLGKALAHYRTLTTPQKESRLYFDIRAVQPVAVLRAPMIGLHLESGNVRMEAIPWIRLVRVDPSGESFLRYSQPMAIDVVHSEFLHEYTAAAYHAATEMAKRMSDFAVAVLTGDAMHDKGVEEAEGSSSEQESEEEPPYRSMRPCVSEDEFMDSWREKGRRLHSPPESEDQ